MTFIGSRKVGIDVLTLVGPREGPKEVDADRFSGMDQDTIEQILCEEQEDRWGYYDHIDDIANLWDNNKNHILDALAEEKAKRDHAVERIRLLVAYAREVVSGNRPTLASLAEVMDMTISGVRGLYGPDDVTAVRELLGGIDQRLYQQLLPIDVRVRKIVDYIDSLFLMNSDPFDDKSRSILETVILATILPEEFMWSDQDGGTWPLDEMKNALGRSAFIFTIAGFSVDIDNMPSPLLEREADSIERVKSFRDQYYGGKKPDAQRASDFAVVIDRIETLLQSSMVYNIATKIRELVNEVVPEQGE